MSPPNGFESCNDCEGIPVFHYLRTLGNDDAPENCPKCDGSGLIATDHLRMAVVNALAAQLNEWYEQQDIRDLCDATRFATVPPDHPELFANADAVLRTIANHLKESNDADVS